MCMAQISREQQMDTSSFTFSWGKRKILSKTKYQRLFFKFYLALPLVFTSDDVYFPWARVYNSHQNLPEKRKETEI